MTLENPLNNDAPNKELTMDDLMAEMAKAQTAGVDPVVENEAPKVGEPVDPLMAMMADAQNGNLDLEKTPADPSVPVTSTVEAIKTPESIEAVSDRAVESAKEIMNNEKLITKVFFSLAIRLDQMEHRHGTMDSWAKAGYTDSSMHVNTLNECLVSARINLERTPDVTPHEKALAESFIADFQVLVNELERTRAGK
jgi:hypothetical protein